MTDSKSSSSPPAKPCLADLFGAWWRARTKLIIITLAGVAVAAIVLFAAKTFSPSHREATLTFRLLFNGAEQGQYPNGMRFTPADLVSELVLHEVYRRHAPRLGGQSFDDFRTAFGVVPHNPALADFRRNFAPRLTAGGLSTVDRQRLEDEYESRRQALENAQFTLVYRPGDGLTDGVSEAVLADVLTVWSEQSRSLGVFKFNRNVYSPNLLRGLAAHHEDYPMLLDRLRITIYRIIENLEEISSIPGAPLVRAGDRNVSLGELEVLLRDDIRYRLSLIEAQVYELGLYRNRGLSDTYIREQLVRLDREATEIASRSAGLGQALANYSASRARPGDGTTVTMDSGSGGNVMPQISEGFLDRMLGLADPQVDVAFRQSLTRQSAELGRELANLESERQVYTRMQENLARVDAASGSQRERLDADVDREVAALTASLRRTLTELVAVHEAISRRDLEPRQIHEIIQPASLHTATTANLVRVGVGLAGIIAVTLGLALVSTGWPALRGTGVVR